MKKCYVYCYLNPLKPGNFVYNSLIGEIKFEFEPFYVGKGSNKRYLDHLNYPNKDKNHFKRNVINKIIKESNKTPFIEFLKQEISSEEALLLEIDLISNIGRRNLNKGPLTNLTDGGEGTSGIVFTEELRKRWSELAKERAKFGSENHSSKKVYQYDLNGNYIQEWSCKEECKRELGFNPAGINACCKGRNKTAFNFQWFDEYQGEKVKAVHKGKNKNDGYLDFKDTRYKKKQK